MSKKNIYLLGILATIIIGSFLYQKLCCSTCDTECCKKETSSVPGADSGAAMMPNLFSLKGNGIDYSSQDSFNFFKNDFKQLLPVADSINLGIASLKTVFDKGGQVLKITGFAKADEVNNSAFPNLGFARANDVKNYFVSKGISSSMIEINGEIRDDLNSKNDTLFSPVSFGIFEKSQAKTAKTEDWSALKTKINANPLILYFKTGQTQIDLSAEDRQKVADMLNYIDHVENAKLDVVGHTDSVGNRDTNIRLGKERADFAKNYLVQNGISTEKINSSSKGPDEPLMDNSTKEGQAKNRRTVVKIN